MDKNWAPGTPLAPRWEDHFSESDSDETASLAALPSGSAVVRSPKLSSHKRIKRQLLLPGLSHLKGRRLRLPSVCRCSPVAQKLSAVGVMSGSLKHTVRLTPGVRSRAPPAPPSSSAPPVFLLLWGGAWHLTVETCFLFS